MTLDQLYNIIISRKKNLPENSYVASLFKDGADRIIQKVSEEAIEVIIAAKTGEQKQIIFESADLIFHLLALLAQFDIKPDSIIRELDRRNVKSIYKNDMIEKG